MFECGEAFGERRKRPWKFFDEAAFFELGEH